MVQAEPERRDRLWSNQRYFSDRISYAGYQLISRETPILPVLIGDEYKTDVFSHALRTRGFHVDAVKFPAVPKGKARLRFIMNAHHTVEQIDLLIQAMQELKSKYEEAVNPILG